MSFSEICAPENHIRRPGIIPEFMCMSDALPYGYNCTNILYPAYLQAANGAVRAMLGVPAGASYGAEGTKTHRGRCSCPTTERRYLLVEELSGPKSLSQCPN